MDINRNNYESFFLLYLDGELDGIGKRAVEAFVQQNPDLGQELDMLRQTLLLPETMAFADKQALYKISTEQEEQLLLHLHNELPTAQAQALEAEMAASPALQREWNLWQQTQLDANEAVPMPNKDSLYRHERGRVVAARWWRIAAAAMLLGAGIWGGLSLLNRESGPIGSGEVAVNKTVGTVQDNKGNNQAAPANSDTANGSTTSETIARAINNAADAVKLPNTVSADTKQPATVAPSMASKTAPQRKLDPAAMAGQNDLDRLRKQVQQQKRSLENFNTDSSNEMAVTNVLPIDSKTKPVLSVPFEKKETAGETPNLRSNAAADAVNDAGASATPSNDYLAVDNRRPRRSPLLRKVGRFFQRSVLGNRSEGDGIKIAGFEFAVNK
jgi:hypothetical protein